MKKVEMVMLLDMEVHTYRKQCPYCGSDFYVNNPQSNRVTCGQLKYQKEWRRVYWQKPENKGLRAHYSVRQRVKLAMLKELERLTGIKPVTTKPT